ncbi:hypothetical protein Rsub_09579 [Raphidocelis subcapitata]|uniref:Choline monooxygenase, chloroplastic n=1 Tax=Raphidocelis subcapitata TaxID=307507 RepID=A0A2V0PHM4_9CHLO|nr:hypothetical protein Rsub_09579 [Raphidocelis subcapitata]|eukprot:GBF97413.1 hypothetical protein Rsub_09579 [Raphidocelis subcapitata]
MLVRTSHALLRRAGPRGAPARSASSSADPQLDPWPAHAGPIEEAVTLPASWYTSPSAPPLERRRVFGASWQLVGCAGAVAAPGRYFAGALAPYRFLVARGDDGVLRAFHNVCRHHAAAVAAGSGSAEAFTCPYHGWTYDTRGRLRAAPRVKGIRAFRAAEWGLRPIAAREWGPFVFLWLGGGGAGQPPPLEDWLGDAGARMAELGVLDPLVHVARRSYEINCNWKVFCDNYLDGGYHVPVAHPELAGQLDLGAYSSALLGTGSVQTCAPEGGAGARLRGGRPAGYFFLYPNAMVNRYGPWMDLNVVTPLDTNRCRVDFDWWLEGGELRRRAEEQAAAVDGGAGAAAAAAEALRGGWAGAGGGAGRLELTAPEAAGLPFVVESLRSSHTVQVEDVSLCEAVQAGLEEPSYGVGRYAPALEGPMFHFHRQIHAAVTGRGHSPELGLAGARLPGQDGGGDGGGVEGGCNGGGGGGGCGGTAGCS